MKSLSKIVMVIAVLLSSINVFAQIKNVKTETVKIYGNCGMCKTNIEKAGNSKKEAQVDWKKDTKIATIFYDATKTNTDEILKRIALAGYDNEKFLAPDDVYAKLPGCCQYERSLKPVSKDEQAHHNHGEKTLNATSLTHHVAQLHTIFNGYFELKNALVQSDANLAVAVAKELHTEIGKIEMNKLSTEEHTIWMKVMRDLAFDVEEIYKNKNIEQQRKRFMRLSENMYLLIKVSNLKTPVYYQHCPMYNEGKGANWLSKEETIKNPFYGSKMLSCGSTVETIK